MTEAGQQPGVLAATVLGPSTEGVGPSPPPPNVEQFEPRVLLGG